MMEKKYRVFEFHPAFFLILFYPFGFKGKTRWEKNLISRLTQQKFEK